MATTKKEKVLTGKEKRFCEEYVATGSATKAYLTAYDCTYNTANSEGCRMLRKPHIHEYITQLQKEAYKAACINAERVALKLSDIAFADKEDEVYGASAQLKALDLLQKQLGLQHQKIEADVNTDINITIEE
jgi:phage terminase small subunit